MRPGGVAVMARIRIQQLPAALRRIRGMIPELEVEMKGAGIRFAFEDVVITSPVGHPARDKHPGKYRASNRGFIGHPTGPALADAAAYPVPGAETIEPMIAAIRPGVPAGIVNDAKSDNSSFVYAVHAIEPGRRRGSRGMIGSPQAPKGVYGPARDKLVRNWRSIAARVYERFQRRVA